MSERKVPARPACLPSCHRRHKWQHGSARGQTEKISAGKFHRFLPKSSRNRVLGRAICEHEAGKPTDGTSAAIAMIGISASSTAIEKLSSFLVCTEGGYGPHWPMPLSRPCCSCPRQVLAHRDISRRRSNSVALRAKRTSARPNGLVWTPARLVDHLASPRDFSQHGRR